MWKQQNSYEKSFDWKFNIVYYIKCMKNEQKTLPN